jgi:hypothetical protein
MQKMILMLSGAMLIAACGREVPLGERAMAAYKAGDYKTALPLLKKWAASPEIAGDREKLKTVMAYVVDAELKTSGRIEGLQVATTTQAATRAGAGSQTSLADLKAQAEEITRQLENKKTEGYTPTGERILHKPVPSGEVRVMTIKELGNFPFDPNKDSDVPADVKALDGAKVRLRGYMLPLTQANHVTDFALLPSLMGCCFGEPPGVEHIITCRIPKARALELVADEILVEGTLRVKVIRDEDYTTEIFSLEVSSVKLAQ